MITELELSLHDGEITLFEYLEEKKAELDMGEQGKLWRETTELEKAKGNTPRMRAYCRKHGLDDIPDLDIVWKKPRNCSVWTIGKNKVFVSMADGEE